MAEKNPKINYGASEAELAGSAADAFQASTALAAQDYQAELDRLSAELTSKIQTGMTAEEKAELDQRLADVQNRYNQSITNIRANYGFAQQQSQAMAGQTQRSLQDIQRAQQALAAQSLGLAGYTGMPGYSATAVDAQRAIQQAGAANLALIGGEGAVPAGAQVRTPFSPTGAGTEFAGGPQAGLIGLSKTAQDMFLGSLLGAEARSLTETEQQLTNIQSQYGLDAARAVRERVQKEKDEVRNFIIQGMQGLLNLKAQQSTTQAQLEAAAAGADTRSGREKANAELDFYKRKSKIDLDNTLKTISAQARGRGASASEVKAIKDAIDITKGEESGFGKLTKQRLANLERVFSGEITPPAGFKFDKANNALYRTSDKLKTPLWKLEFGVLAFNNGTAAKPQWVEVNMGGVLNKLTKQVGALQSLPKDKQLTKFTKFFNQDSDLQSSVVRQALTVILGPGASKPDFYIKTATSPLPTAPFAPTKQQTPKQTSKLPSYDLSKGFGSGTSSSKTTPKTSKGSTSTGYGGPTPPKSKKGSTTNTGYTGYTGPRR
jgi:hypothetical protein